MNNWGIDKTWEQFLICVIAHMMFPFLPLLFELWKTNTIGPSSLTIATAMYAMSIGLSSKISLITLTCGFVSLVFSFAYGDSIATQRVLGAAATSLTGVENFAVASILLIFISHLIERYVRHIVNEEDFMTFVRKSKRGGV